jgi:DNA-binding NarL/FixJ family response regulator
MNIRTKTLIVDDHAVFRSALREFLEGLGDFEIVGEAGNGKEAVKLSASLSPDLVVMDVNMPELDGRKACVEIKRKKAGPIVVLYSMDTASLLYGCSGAGADRCLAKDELFEKLGGLRDMCGSMITKLISTGLPADRGQRKIK